MVTLDQSPAPDPCDDERRPAHHSARPEDDAIVGMMIEAELGDAGYTVVGPFATCASASDWLASHTPDAAVLDHTLRDGPCTDVAMELRRRGVPIVVLTGADQNKLPDVLKDAP
jgi:DNA-binding response OmpR family regulator